MEDWQPVLSAVATAYKAHTPEWTDGSLRVSRVDGGYNNALFRIEVGSNSYACKLLVADERYRAKREFTTLRLLQSAGLVIAPRPVLLDSSTGILPYHVVIYEWLDGDLLSFPLAEGQLDALADSLQRLHSLTREDYIQFDLPEAWFHWFEYQPYLSEMDSLLALYGTWIKNARPQGREVYERLEALVHTCKRLMRKEGIVNPARGTFPLRLCRVDPNLDNCVWVEKRKLYWVDWEYSGWGDPALELADLRWHVAWSGLSEAEHALVRQKYIPPLHDTEFAARLKVWDRLIVTRWPLLILRLLWSYDNGPDRPRLSYKADNPDEILERLEKCICRAEAFSG